jgi:ankyrin repeat protein
LYDFQDSIYDYFKNGADEQDLAQSFSQNLKALMPESMFSNHPTNLQMIVSQDHSSNAANFLNLTLFMVSNKLIGQDSDISAKVYNWIKRHSDAGFLGYLLSINGPTIEALAEQLFSLAIEAGDARTVKNILDSGLDPNELRCSGTWKKRVTPLQRACELHSLELVRTLLDAGADVNSSSSSADFLLSRAIHMDKYEKMSDYVDIAELVQLLLREGANVNAAWPGGIPLINAAANCHVELVNVLLSAGGDPNVSDNDCTPLTEAVRSKGSISNIISIVRHLLQAGGYVCVTAYDGTYEYPSTVLELALCQSSVDLIQVLFEGGAYITESALITAVNEGNLEIIKLFLRSGAQVTHDAIEAAASEVESEIFWLLLDSADNDIKEIGRSRALAAAIHYGRKDLFDNLSASGSKLQRGFELTAAIEAAAKRGDIWVFHSLLHEDSIYRACAFESLGCSLRFAIANGRSDITEILLAAGASVNPPNINERSTPLLEAIIQKDVDLSQRLLAAGAAVNNTFSFSSISSCANPWHGTSILPAAVTWGYFPLIRDMIGAGADIDAPELQNGKPALIVAIESGDPITIQVLIDAGADVSAPSESGETALAAAVRNNDINIVRYLLAIGADPNERSLIAAIPKTPELMQILLTARLTRYQRYSRGFGSRTLQHAIISSNAAMIRVILSNGVDPNTILGSHYCFIYSKILGRESAFGTAIRLDTSKDLWIIQMLLRSGADPNKIVDETHNHTALLAAIERKSLGCVKMLVAVGANVNPELVGSIFRTPLQLAVEQGAKDITDVLLEQGADVNTSPCHQYGATALQFAAIKGYLGLASILLEKGADINALPARVGGRTALEGAAEHGRIDILQLLLNAGAQITGLGSKQYERARKFASKNGHIAARRLLEAFHPEKLDSHAFWDPLAMDVGDIEDLGIGDWT